MSKLYVGIVAWNGNHYFQGEEVYGTEFKKEDGKLYLYDDRPDNNFYGIQEETWVEVIMVQDVTYATDADSLAAKDDYRNYLGIKIGE